MTVKNVEKLEKSRVAVTVEVGAEEFEAAVAKAYAKARGKLSIPGFRPGKAPRKMIEKLYGAGVFYSDAVDIALPEAYTQAIGQSGLDVVGYPEIEIVDDKIDENGFTFKATVAVYPEVKLGEYKGLTAEKEEIKVSADDVKERLNEMAERNARLVSVDRKAKKGDIAVIDFEGFDNGEAFEGGKGENYELELGSGSFVPGFEDQVIGMKAGEEKDLDITFPEDYHKDLAGKKVVFHVKAKEIKCKELPKLDDDFAKDVSEYDTLKELKDSIKREITEQREQSAKYAVENELMEKVAANIECDIPDALIDEQCARFLEEFKQRLQSQGIPYDQYCKMTNMDEAKFLEEGKEPATRQVRMDLAVNAIIKEEKLEATDEEVEKQYNDLAEKYSMDVGELKKYLDAMSVRTQIIRDKAISVVVDSAKIEKKKAPKKEAEGEAAEGEEKPAKKTAAKKSAKKEEEKAKAAEEEKEKDSTIISYANKKVRVTLPKDLTSFHTPAREISRYSYMEESNVLGYSLYAKDRTFTIHFSIGTDGWDSAEAASISHNKVCKDESKMYEPCTVGEYSGYKYVVSSDKSIEYHYVLDYLVDGQDVVLTIREELRDDDDTSLLEPLLLDVVHNLKIELIGE